MRPAILILIPLLILTACAAPQDPLPGAIEQPIGQPELNATVSASPSPPDATATPPESELPVSSPKPPKGLPSMETPLANPGVDAIVQKAKEMLADKLGTDPGGITLFNLQARDWPDEALGCPIGSQNYAQVITPGYLVELEAEGNIYAFHTDRSTRVVLCAIAPTREIYQPP